MEGLYVDDQHCMHIIARGRAEGTWLVYAADATDAGWTDEVRGGDVLVLDSGRQNMSKGRYKDGERVEWDSGDVWHRLHTSYDQQAYLLRRPYVPLTLVFFSSVWYLIKAAYVRVTGKRAE